MIALIMGEMAPVFIDTPHRGEIAQWLRTREDARAHIVISVPKPGRGGTG